MNTIRLPLVGTLLTVLLLATSCLSPVTTKSPQRPVVTLAADDARLVFKLSKAKAAARALEDANYLTVKLTLNENGAKTVKYKNAQKSGDEYSVTVGGMVAGTWSLQVMLYDNSTSQNLLYYAYQNQYIAIGTSTNVNVALYPAGSIGGVTTEYAVVADHVDLIDSNGEVSDNPATPKLLAMGVPFELDAVTLASDADNNVPATEYRVTWSTTDDSIARVSSSGKVTPLEVGEVAIIATSVENKLLTKAYYIRVVPALFGEWKLSDEFGGLFYRFTADTFVWYSWDSDYTPSGVRGTYTFDNGVATLNVEEILGQATNGWLTIPPEEAGEPLILTVSSVTNSTLGVTFSGGVATEPAQNRVHSRSAARLSSPVLTLSRVTTFVPLTGVTFDVGQTAGDPLAWTNGGGGTKFLDTPTFTPSNATIPAYFLVSNDPDIVYADEEDYGRINASYITSGSTTVSVLAVDSLNEIGTIYTDVPDWN